MNEKQAKVLELSKKYEQLENEMDEVRSALEAALTELPLNSYFQDEVTGAVYKIMKPKGKFVYYKEVDYNRTAIGDEVKGSLSKKEAKEAGYSV